LLIFIFKLYDNILFGRLRLLNNILTRLRDVILRCWLCISILITNFFVLLGRLLYILGFLRMLFLFNILDVSFLNIFNTLASNLLSDLNILIRRLVIILDVTRTLSLCNILSCDVNIIRDVILTSHLDVILYILHNNILNYRLDFINFLVILSKLLLHESIYYIYATIEL